MIEISVSRSATTLTVVGDLDLSERDRFPELLVRLAEIRFLTIDLCQARFVDSTGAAFLVALGHGVLNRGGEPVLRVTDESIVFVLEICGALALYEQHSCGNEPPHPHED